MLKRVAAIAAALVLVLSLTGCAEEVLGIASGLSAGSSTEQAQGQQPYRELSFRSHSKLMEHYRKHGREMGFATAEEYEQAAEAVANNPAALHKLEAEDGDDVYYLESTNEIVFVSQDGYIRTYFNPNTGKRYFERQ